MSASKCCGGGPAVIAAWNRLRAYAGRKREVGKSGSSVILKTDAGFVAALGSPTAPRAVPYRRRAERAFEGGPVQISGLLVCSARLMAKCMHGVEIRLICLGERLVAEDPVGLLTIGRIG